MMYDMFTEGLFQDKSPQASNGSSSTSWVSSFSWSSASPYSVTSNSAKTSTTSSTSRPPCSDGTNNTNNNSNNQSVRMFTVQEENDQIEQRDDGVERSRSTSPFYEEGYEIPFFMQEQAQSSSFRERYENDGLVENDETEQCEKREKQDKEESSCHQSLSSGHLQNFEEDTRLKPLSTPASSYATSCAEQSVDVPTETTTEHQNVYEHRISMQAASDSMDSVMASKSTIGDINHFSPETSQPTKPKRRALKLFKRPKFNSPHHHHHHKEDQHPHGGREMDTSDQEEDGSHQAFSQATFSQEAENSDQQYTQKSFDDGHVLMEKNGVHKDSSQKSDNEEFADGVIHNMGHINISKDKDENNEKEQAQEYSSKSTNSSTLPPVAPTNKAKQKFKGLVRLVQLSKMASNGGDSNIHSQPSETETENTSCSVDHSQSIENANTHISTSRDEHIATQGSFVPKSLNPAGSNVSTSRGTKGYDGEEHKNRGVRAILRKGLRSTGSHVPSSKDQNAQVVNVQSRSQSNSREGREDGEQQHEQRSFVIEGSPSSVSQGSTRKSSSHSGAEHDKSDSSSSTEAQEKNVKSTERGGIGSRALGDDVTVVSEESKSFAESPNPAVVVSHYCPICLNSYPLKHGREAMAIPTIMTREEEGEEDYVASRGLNLQQSALSLISENSRSAFLLCKDLESGNDRWLYRLESCDHAMCLSCLRSYLAAKVLEYGTRADKLSCCRRLCDAPITPRDVRRILLLTSADLQKEKERRGVKNSFDPSDSRVQGSSGGLFNLTDIQEESDSEDEGNGIDNIDGRAMYERYKKILSQEDDLDGQGNIPNSARYCKARQCKDCRHPVVFEMQDELPKSCPCFCTKRRTRLVPKEMVMECKNCAAEVLFFDESADFGVDGFVMCDGTFDLCSPDMWREATSLSTMTNRTRRRWEEATNLVYIDRSCRRCPNCRIPVQKDGGCDELTCAACKDSISWDDCRGCDWENRVRNPEEGLLNMVARTLAMTLSLSFNLIPGFILFLAGNSFASAFVSFTGFWIWATLTMIFWEEWWIYIVKLLVPIVLGIFLFPAVVVLILFDGCFPKHNGHSIVRVFFIISYFRLTHWLPKRRSEETSFDPRSRERPLVDA